jgi:hypothetical protein
MPNETAAEGAATEDQTTAQLQGFHKAMSARTLERDTARSEAAALRQQIADLAAMAPSDDGESDDGTVYRRRADGTFVPQESPTPRHTIGRREFGTRQEVDPFALPTNRGYPV